MATIKYIKRRHSFLYKNSLSIVFILFTVITLLAQLYTGWKEHNDFLTEYDAPTISISRYITSGHFLQATFENWESEFFQMALFVILTIFLRQKGSSESKKLDDEPGEDDLKAKPDSPWPVKKGGLALAIYQYSLSIALLLLFLISFTMHWYGSWLDFNEKQFLESKPLESFSAYLTSTKFWFESFQNWQSEFLSVFAVIFLSIYLRQKGSSQSKPVNAPHDETGE
jgi:hypothetical protein